MKRIAILIPFVFWMLLSVFDMTSFALHYRPMYFRAWEYVLNDGLDSYYVPFKPLLYYNGIMTGDLTDMMNYLPEKKNVGHQMFQVDEYGWRNPVGMLKHPVEAVTIGTSWVGGAHLTQNDLVATMLTNQYGIRTYNYATQPLQHFWEDSRFKAHPPKYVLIIGNEDEFLQNSYIEYLVDDNITDTIQKWNSYPQWASVNEPLPTNYTSLATTLKQYSVVKFYLREIYLHITNAFFSREQLSYFYGKQNWYDAKDDILFFNFGEFDPTMTGPFAKDINPTINTLLTTQSILKKRGITMIVAIMPSKESMQAPQYQKLPLKDKILYYLEKDMTKEGIPHISLLAPLSKYVNNTNHLVYFAEDSHWDAYPNEVIAKALDQKIKSMNK